MRLKIRQVGPMFQIAEVSPGDNAPERKLTERRFCVTSTNTLKSCSYVNPLSRRFNGSVLSNLMYFKVSYLLNRDPDRDTNFTLTLSSATRPI